MWQGFKYLPAFFVTNADFEHKILTGPIARRLQTIDLIQVNVWKRGTGHKMTKI